MKRMNITDQEHDAFVKAHPNGDLLQLTKWGDTKKLTGWYAKRIAVGENGELKGVGQLLFKDSSHTFYALLCFTRFRCGLYEYRRGEGVTIRSDSSCSK